MKKTNTLFRLEKYMENRKIFFYFSLFLGALSSFLNLLPFIFIWLIIKELFTNLVAINENSIMFYALMTIASAFASMFCYFLALAFSHLSAFRVEVKMREQAMEKIMSFPLGYFNNNSSGKLRKIIDESTSSTHTFLAHQMPDFAGTIVTPILLLVLLFVFDWRLGLVSLIPLVLGFGATMTMMSKKGQEFTKAYMDQLELMSAEAVEYIRGIPVVKTFGGSVYAFKNFVNSITKYKQMVIAYTLLWSSPMSFYTAITQSFAFFLIPFSIFFISSDNIALVLTDFIFYLLIAPNFALIFMRSMYFKHHSEMTGEIVDRFDKALECKPMSFNDKELKLQDMSLEFKNVSFYYEKTNKKILDNISFKINQGECYALVGASGGGKTTIARLAARFWDIQSGEILIGGVNIKEISKKDISNLIAFVFQNTQLFTKSIKENIVLENKNYSDEDLQKAIELSQSQEIIEKLPNGIDTLVGSEVYLSGGERQRISIARAILKNSPIILLDEATAFSDPENEHLIHKALKELRKGKTTLMIAHRLTSVIDADKILVIDDGKIVQIGNHTELLEQGGIYKNMWEEYQKSINWTIKGVKND